MNMVAMNIDWAPPCSRTEPKQTLHKRPAAFFCHYVPEKPSRSFVCWLHFLTILTLLRCMGGCVLQRTPHAIVSATVHILFFGTQGPIWQ
jgi:hypothetical protein